MFMHYLIRIYLHINNNVNSYCFIMTGKKIVLPFKIVNKTTK